MYWVQEFSDRLMTNDSEEKLCQIGHWIFLTRADNQEQHVNTIMII